MSRSLRLIYFPKGQSGQWQVLQPRHSPPLPMQAMSIQVSIGILLVIRIIQGK